MVDSIVFNGELTSLYPMNESSGGFIDAIGGHDWVSNANAVFNGNSITYNGVNAIAISDTRDSTNGVFIDILQDHTVYMHLKTLSQVGAISERWFRPRFFGPDAEGPFVNLAFGVELGKYQVQSPGFGDFPNVDLKLTRDVNANEEFLLIFSYKRSAKQMVAVLRSFDGINVFGSDTGTVVPGFEFDDSYLLFDNSPGVNLSNVELFEMGAIDGTFKTLSQIRAAAEGFINPGNGGIILPIANPILSKLPSSIY